MLSSVPWAIQFGEADVNIMLGQAQDVLDWYSDFNLFIPKWYVSNNQI